MREHEDAKRKNVPLRSFDAKPKRESEGEKSDAGARKLAVVALTRAGARGERATRLFSSVREFPRVRAMGRTIRALFFLVRESCELRRARAAGKTQRFCSVMISLKSSRTFDTVCDLILTIYRPYDGRHVLNPNICLSACIFGGSTFKADD